MKVKDLANPENRAYWDMSQTASDIFARMHRDEKEYKAFTTFCEMVTEEQAEDFFVKGYMIIGDYALDTNLEIYAKKDKLEEKDKYQNYMAGGDMWGRLPDCTNGNNMALPYFDKVLQKYFYLKNNPEAIIKIATRNRRGLESGDPDALHNVINDPLDPLVKELPQKATTVTWEEFLKASDITFNFNDVTITGAPDDLAFKVVLTKFYFGWDVKKLENGNINIKGETSYSIYNSRTTGRDMQTILFCMDYVISKSKELIIKDGYEYKDEYNEMIKLYFGVMLKSGGNMTLLLLHQQADLMRAMHLPMYIVLYLIKVIMFFKDVTVQDLYNYYKLIGKNPDVPDAQKKTMAEIIGLLTKTSSMFMEQLEDGFKQQNEEEQEEAETNGEPEQQNNIP